MTTGAALAQVAIGFRAGPKGFDWAVVARHPDSGELAVNADGRVAMTATFDVPNGLVEVRSRVRQLLTHHSPVIGGVRTPETVGPGGKSAGAHARIRVEGVVLEALASAGVPALSGALATMAGDLGSTAKKAKSYLKSGDFRGLDLTGKADERREAIMAAAAALHHVEKGAGRDANQD